MKTGVARFGAVTLAVLMALTPTPSAAIAPVLLMMVREIAQQVATLMIKDPLLSGLSGMGCKGIALSKARTAFELRGGAGGTAGMLGGMPKMPAGIRCRACPPACAAELARRHGPVQPACWPLHWRWAAASGRPQASHRTSPRR